MEEKMLSPLKTIRAYCVHCCCESANEVKLCGAKDCKLYPYRFGKSVNRKPRILTDEQRKVLSDRLQKARNTQG